MLTFRVYRRQNWPWGFGFIDKGKLISLTKHYSGLNFKMSFNDIFNLELCQHDFNILFSLS